MASISDEQMFRLIEQVTELAKRQNEADAAINDLAGVVRICLERIVNLDARVMTTADILAEKQRQDESEQ